MAEKVGQGIVPFPNYLGGDGADLANTCRVRGHGGLGPTRAHP